MTPGRGKGAKGSTAKTPNKSKGGRSSQTGKVVGIRKFFEAKAGRPSSNLGIGSKEDRRTDSQEPALEPEPGKGKNYEKNQLERD